MDYDLTPSSHRSQSTKLNINGSSLSNSDVDSCRGTSQRKAMIPRSWTKTYFVLIDGKKTCKICNENVKTYNSSTTELIKHLAIHNIDDSTEINEIHSYKRQRLDFSDESDVEGSDNDQNGENVVNETSSKRKKTKIDVINSKLLAFILNNDLPFRIVESKEFQELIDSIKKDYYKLPCRQTLRNTLLYNQYENLKQRLIFEFSQIHYGSVTTDCWSSNSNLSYLGVTFHYLDIYMTLQSRVLCLYYLEESHTGPYLSQTLSNILTKWHLNDKIFAFTTDSAANMTSALNLTEPKAKKIPCSAHRLHLCVNDLFKIKKIKTKYDKELKREVKCVYDMNADGVFKDVVLNDEMFVNIDALNLIKTDFLNPLMSKCRSRIKLVQEIPTRWSSSYDMLNSILVNKNALISISVDREFESVKANMLSEYEFCFLDEFCTLLQPLKDLTEFFSGSKYVTCSILHPAIFTLVNYDLLAMDLRYINVISIRDEMINSLKKRFNYVLNDQHNDIFKVSTFLDLNYKKFSYIKNEEVRLASIERGKRLVIKIATDFLKDKIQSKTNFCPLTSLTNPSNVRANRPQKEKNNSDFLNKLQDPVNDDDLPVNELTIELEQELKTYLTMNVSLPNKEHNKYNSLNFFNSYAGTLPNFLNVAKLVFSVPATSVPAESLFSSAGLVQDDLRNKLHPASLDMINFIKNNRKIDFLSN
ncbi:unnamed protein product [Brachionus calyciflorus]|uniref:HAT C-terminal dimerisation domain-containing protein n=1 Tax=Brachionus calyciflorus TaxID=104777 RepID=A0A814LUS0_9BILA|nr:unnamed protein product [Brachionus calyciflorus]